MQQIITASNAGTGTYTIQLPNYWCRIESLFMSIATDATVGTRNFTLQVNDSAGNAIIAVFGTAAASSFATFMAPQGVAGSWSSPLLVPPNSTLTLTGRIGAADTVNQTQVVVREAHENP
jgi:hypothetical protein